MKPISIIKLLGIAALAWTTLSFTACCTEKFDEHFVDLRYDVLDVYELPHTDPEVVTLRVRSLYNPWVIEGSSDADWYTVSPSRGAAGETVIVTIKCKNNTELDDREDLLSIKSSYWTGKQFRLFQKGTAYLEADGFDLAKDADDYTLSVFSNQKWSAEVTNGADWLSITSGTNGENNGEVKFHAVDNKSERRPGTITLYDRYDRPTVDVIFTQNGVVLDWYKPYDEDPEPDEPEVDWIRYYYQDTNATIPVSSNARFTVEKGDPENEDWFTIETANLDGSFVDGATPQDLELKLTMTENTSTQVRVGTLKLTTIPESSDVEPVVREIKFKQANNPQPNVLSENLSVVIAGNRIKTGVDAGRYDFKVKGANGKRMEILFLYPDKPINDGPRELRYWTNRVNGTDDGIPMMSTTPWCDNPFNIDACVNFSKNDNPGTYARIDKSQEHTLSLEIQKAKVEGKDELWARIIWYIDGETIKLGNGNNESIMLSTNQWNMNFEEMTAETAYIMVRGEFTLIECSLTPPIDWGN